MRLAGKIALVTGAASGIGKSVVSAFRAEGAQVIGADTQYDGFQPLESNIAESVHLDVSDEAEWERLAKRFPRFDLIAACAGISEAKPLTETRLCDWQRVMRANLKGAFLSVKYGAKSMQQSGGDRAGGIGIRNQSLCWRERVLRQQSSSANVSENGGAGIQTSGDSGQLRFAGRSGHSDVAEDAFLA